MRGGKRVVPAAGRAGRESAAYADRIARRHGRDGAPESLRPPRASLGHGAAGIAYFLLRYGTLRQDAAALEAAGRWVAAAEEAVPDPGRAFFWPDLPADRFTPRSLHYHEPGVWYVRALVGLALGEEGETRGALTRFVGACDVPDQGPCDATLGSASLLLGTACLVEAAGQTAASCGAHDAGVRLASRLSAMAGAAHPSANDPLRGLLGAAHGWAGIAHALLRWSEATGDPPGPDALALVELLAAHRRPSGLWPVEACSRAVQRGWCHGSAGWAHLWLLAWRLTGDDRLLGHAERAGDDAVAAVAADEEVDASLCCGRAGAAYAALALHRSTRDDRWLAAAQGAAEEAIHGAGDPGLLKHSLMRGEVGIALLLTELARPDRAAMPLYEPLL